MRSLCASTCFPVQTAAFSQREYLFSGANRCGLSARVPIFRCKLLRSLCASTCFPEQTAAVSLREYLFSSANRCGLSVRVPIFRSKPLRVKSPGIRPELGMVVKHPGGRQHPCTLHINNKLRDCVLRLWHKIPPPNLPQVWLLSGSRILGREITVSRRGDIFWRDPPRVIFVYYSLCVCLVLMKRDNSEVRWQGPPRAIYMYYSLCVFSCSCET
jgi:hypothetical protein